MNENIVARLEESFDRKNFNELNDVSLEKLLSVVMEKLGKNSLSLTREEVVRVNELSKKGKKPRFN
ncbi:hypothetical protein V6760_01365 [Acinetobacter venetianus]